MSEASYASLGPTLLARKGGAKPAMRPQLAPLPLDPAETAALADEALEDLGWNDMGQDDDPETGYNYGADDYSADIVSIKSASTSALAFALASNDADITGSASPIVRRQQRQLSERVLAAAVMEKPGTDHEVTRLRTKPQNAMPAQKLAKTRLAHRAAFTLRLDTDRHLKLRLAATMQGLSAQALVTEALDALFAEIEDLDSLAARMKRT
jgi:hypothetical protein